MNIFFAGIVAALVFSAGAAVAAEAPATITFDAKQGKVTFAHKTHAERLRGDCKACRRRSPRAARSRASTRTRLDALCKKCHETEKKGPTECADCHKK